MAKEIAEPNVEINQINKVIEGIDLGALESNLRALFILLLNRIEELEKTVKELQVENQKLRDENNYLKASKENPRFGLRRHLQTFSPNQRGRI